MRTARRSSWEQGIRINYVAPCYIKSAIRSAEVEKHLLDHGVEFGYPEDVASCMMRISTERTLNGGCIIKRSARILPKIRDKWLTAMDLGHSMLIVPRSIAKEGYIDACLDDFVEDGIMKSFQDLQLKVIKQRWVQD